MYAPPPPPAVPTAPTPGIAPTPPRYPYLVGRLRGRQITMEEATELFGLMEAMLRANAMAAAQAAADAAGMTGAPSEGAPSEAPAGSTGSPKAAMPPVTDEAIALGLLSFGVGAGLLAAIFKRAQAGPPETGSGSAGAGRPSR